jgi:ribosomal-protein-alanine N-acetyltransferase
LKEFLCGSLPIAAISALKTFFNAEIAVIRRGPREKTHKPMKKASILEEPSAKERDEFLAAVRRSRKLHRRWVSPPGTAERFDAYVARLRKGTHLSYWVRTEEGELAGVFSINEIVRGIFCSGYLGYYAFAPYAGRGYMKKGLCAVLSEAFGRKRLHRLEANIQPENEASRRLVQSVGFRLEGFSPRYLKIAGRWRDHERWAITAEEWRSRSRKLTM